MVADVELLVDPVGQAEGIQQAILAGGTLTGHHRTDQRAGAAGEQAVLTQEVDEGLDVLMLDALNFQGQTGGHGHLAGAELLGSLGNGLVLLGGDLTIAGNDPDIEHIGIPLVLQAAQGLHPLDLLGRQLAALEAHLYIVHEQAAFQRPGIRVAVGLQPVLQEVAPLALGTDQQQLFVLLNALNGAGDLGKVHPFGAGNGGGGADVDDLVALGLACQVLSGGHGLVAAFQLVLQNVAGLNKGMDGGGEGRRVGVVQGIEILYLGTHGDAGNGDVHHLIHGAAAQDLNAQELVALSVGDQLGHERCRIGIVMGLVVGNTGDGNHIVARGPGLLFGQAGAACVQSVGELHHAGAHAAAVGCVPAGQVLGQKSSGDVGGGAHGGPLALTRNAVGNHGAVAHGVDVLQIGLLVAVHHNGALEHFNAGIIQEGGSGTDTDGHHHHVGLKAAHSGADAGGLLGAQNGLKARAGDHPDALGLKLTADVVGDFGIEEIRHHLGGHVHHGDLQALGKQVLGNFQTDESAAHHHSAAAVVVIHISAQADGVIGGTHGEYAGQVLAGHIGNEGRRAGGDDQLVVGHHLAVCEGNRLGRSIHFGCLHLGFDLYPGKAHVLFGGVDDELVPGLDQPAYIVGQAAAGIGDILALGVNGDLCAAVLTHQLGGGFGACGNAADDNNVHFHRSFFVLESIRWGNWDGTDFHFR